MKIGLVEKVLIALSVIVVLGSMAFAVNAQPKPDSVVLLKTLDMTCASCFGTIEKTLLGKPGVSEVKVDVNAARVIAVYDSRFTGPEALADTVTTAGYRSRVARTMSIEQFRGQNPAVITQANKGGCGSSCCN